MTIVFTLLLYVALFRLATYKLVGGVLLFNAVSWTALWITLGAREIEFGSDTAGYVRRFDYLQQLSWSGARDLIFSGALKDPGFYLLAKTISSIGLDSRGWLIFLAGVFCLSAAVAVQRYSPAPLLSFMTAICLGSVYFATTGLRQTLAMSVLLWTYEALREGRRARFVFLVAVASIFHSSALLFLLAYPLSRWASKWGSVFIIGLGALAGALFPDAVRQLIGELAWNEALVRYSSSAVSLNLSGFAIFVSVYLFAWFRASVIKSVDPQATIFLNLVAVGAAFQALVVVVAEFFRVASMFTLAAVVLIPITVVWGTRGPYRAVSFGAVFSCLLAYLVLTAPFDGFQVVFLDG